MGDFSGVFDDFTEGIRKAKALAMFQGYLDDVVNQGGTKTVHAFEELLSDSSFIKICTRVVESESLLYYIDTAKSMDLFGLTEKVKDEIREFVRQYGMSPDGLHGVAMNTLLLRDKALLEQAVVCAITAFEVYFQDILEHFIRNDSGFRSRMFKFVDSNILKTELVNNRMNLNDAVTRAEVRSIDTSPARLRSYLHLALGNGRVSLDDDTTMKKIDNLRELRHIIVHNGCRASQKYIKITGYGGALGKRVPLDRQEILTMITVIDNTVTQAHKSLSSLFLSITKPENAGASRQSDS